ncbi:MAG: hypothetical protein U0166_24160 [Acidobacteriota bacterium]
MSASAGHPTPPVSGTGHPGISGIAAKALAAGAVIAMKLITARATPGQRGTMGGW